jgi:hypothetical protein
MMGKWGQWGTMGGSHDDEGKRSEGTGASRNSIALYY